MATVEEQTAQITSAQDAIAILAAAPNATLFTVEEPGDNSLKVTIRPVVVEGFNGVGTGALRAVAKTLIEDTKLNAVRTALEIKLKQLSWDVAQSASPTADSQKTLVDAIIALYLNDPDVVKV